MKKSLVILVLFLITRLIIWFYRPLAFSEIIYSYMPYAHLWAGGTMPYLEQWYEYPPATIPLFFLPHLIDMKTLGSAFHLDYLTSYRGILLLVDVLIFWGLNKALKKLKVRENIRLWSLVYYSLVTTKAHNFIYDSMDLSFTACILFSVIAPLIFKTKGYLMGWISMILGTALKYVNAPLGIIMAGFESKNWRALLVNVFLAGLIVWAVPLFYFRSSLLVSFVYHQQRGLQVESTPAQIVSTINRFTNTEKYAEVYKNYDIQGPVSQKAKKVFDILFPVSLLWYVIYMGIKAYHSPKAKENQLRILMTLGYVCLFMLTAKVLSTPFLLWHIPLVALFPAKSLKDKLPLFIASALIITASMTKIPNVLIGIIPLHLILGWIRVSGFAYLFYQSLRGIKNI